MNFIKRFSLVTVICLLLLTVVSCGGVSENYANKINDAAEAKEYIEYEDVCKKIGEKNLIDFTAEVVSVRGGVVIGVKGCNTWDEIEDKLDEGKTVKGIYVVIANGKAISAEYREITAKDKK